MRNLTKKIENPNFMLKITHIIGKKSQKKADIVWKKNQYMGAMIEAPQ